MDHHDEYDSEARLFKKLRINEVKKYREELYSDIKTQFSAIPVFGTPVASIAEEMGENIDTKTGQYQCASDNSMAEILVSRLIDGRYFVSGTAFWGTSNPGGPHTGEFEATAKDNGKMLICILTRYFDEYAEDENSNPLVPTVILFFTEENIIVKQDNLENILGMNVSFDGTYTRIN